MRRPAARSVVAPRAGERFTGRVRDLANDGQGIVAHPEGRVFFVPGVWVGEVGRFRITGFRGRHGYARLEQLLEPAAGRRAPPCPHHGFGPGDCGGCPWMFVQYTEQLAAKQRRVESALAALAPGDRLRPILPAPMETGYRFRAQFKTDGQVLGFVAAGSREIAPIGDCLVLSQTNRATLRSLVKCLPAPAWRPAARQAWTTLDIDESVDATAVSVNARLPFQQPNDAQNAMMRHWLATQLRLVPGPVRVLELFAGSGNFTEIMAASGATQVLAVDVVEEAASVLRAKALRGVEVLTCDLFADAAAATLGRRAPGFDTLVLDPPREGFAGIDALLSACASLRRVYYISCDLATFRRDLELLLARGFHVDHVQPLDALPQTPHVELLAALSRAGAS